jgi:hypothetical protein
VAAAERIASQLETLVTNCAGIEVQNVACASESAITLSHLRHWRRMEFDYLSTDESSAPPSPRP